MRKFLEHLEVNQQQAATPFYLVLERFLICYPGFQFIPKIDPVIRVKSFKSDRLSSRL